MSAEPEKDKGFKWRETILTGLVFGTSFFAISKVLGRFFKRDEDD